MNKRTIQTQKRLLGFIYGLGGKLEKRPLILSRYGGVKSNSSIDYHLDKLVQKGLLKIESPGWVGWVVPGCESQQQVDRKLAIIGDISTDTPTSPWSTEEENTTEEEKTLEDVRRFLRGHSVQVPAELVERFGEFFALRVKGTGMIDNLIDDGDIVLVKPAAHANNGELILAFFIKEGTSILRKFYSEGRYVRLQPGNSKMDSIYAPKENVELHGKIVGVIRALG